MLVDVPDDTLFLFTALLKAALGTGCCFRLLYRSSRDGVDAAAFDARCDGVGSTLTLVKDTDGNVFGGYTTVQWRSSADLEWRYDPDAFLVTVVNPHADPPARFLPRGYMYTVAASRYGPYFGDVLVDGAFCCTDIGVSYMNSSRHAGGTVLTGARNCTPVEVETWRLV